MVEGVLGSLDGYDGDDESRNGTNDNESSTESDSENEEERKDHEKKVEERSELANPNDVIACLKEVDSDNNSPQNPFAWSLSEKVSCYITIDNGHLRFHILSERYTYWPTRSDYPGINNQKITLTLENLEVFTKALWSRIGGYFILHTEHPTPIITVFEMYNCCRKLFGRLYTHEADKPTFAKIQSIDLNTEELQVLQKIFDRWMEVSFFIIDYFI